MPRNRERGDAAMAVLYIVGLAIAWYTFLFIKDWIHETKERRAGRGAQFEEEVQPTPVASKEESGSFNVKMRY